VTFEKTIEITQVLLLKDDKFAKLAAPALWAGFEEVRRFFGTAGDLIRVPIEGVSFVDVRPKFTSYQSSPDRPILDRQALVPIWRDARRGAATYDQQVLGELVKTAARLQGTSVIVTDVELVPPPEWRYIIWDAFHEGVVVSLAPLDPLYWGERVLEPERVATIKVRVRAACLSIVGQLLGLARCDNDKCYLFANVDSVVRLDAMSYLGPEHGVDELAYRGFDRSSGMPSSPQDVVQVSRETA
jgi:hypothetical protein